MISATWSNIIFIFNSHICIKKCTLDLHICTCHNISGQLYHPMYQMGLFVPDGVETYNTRLVTQTLDLGQFGHLFVMHM